MAATDRWQQRSFASRGRATARASNRQRTLVEPAFRHRPCALAGTVVLHISTPLEHPLRGNLKRFLPTLGDPHLGHTGAIFSVTELIRGWKDGRMEGWMDGWKDGRMGASERPYLDNPTQAVAQCGDSSAAWGPRDAEQTILRKGNLSVAHGVCPCASSGREMICHEYVARFAPKWTAPSGAGPPKRKREGGKIERGKD